MAQPRTVRTDKYPAELLNLRISAEQRQQLNKAAKQRKTSVSELVRSMITEQLSA
jgi:predicted HicB family RNase H-like nuclease